MNRLLAIAVLCIALQLGNAAMNLRNVQTCIQEKGLEKEVNKELLVAIGDPDSADKLKDVPKDKLTGVVACFYRLDSDKARSLHDVMKSLLNTDNKLTEDQKKQMLDTLTDCNTKANGDDEKLLQCVKITDAPFDKIGAILLASTDNANQCFMQNGLNTDDIFIMRNLRKSVADVIAHVDEDKLACGFACVFEKERQSHPEKTDTLIGEKLTRLVNQADLSKDQNKSAMLETIQRCTAEAGKDECKFLKCIKLFRPPFSSLFFAN